MSEPREIPGFVFHGPVRTKKTGQQIVTIPNKGAHRCRACGHIKGFPRLIPSEAYKVWHLDAMRQSLGIKSGLKKAGIALPIAGLVSIKALVYQDANRADAVGLYESIADLLQDCGILQNDRQIEHWDGSRRLVDKANPRVEIYLSVLVERAVQEELVL